MSSGPENVPDVGEYRIVRRLGRGGMGSVFLAEHAHLKRPAAVKVLSPATVDDLSFRARFMREYEIVAALEHPNIVPVYDAGFVDDAPYIAMRYVDGGDLAVLVQDGPLAVGDTVAVVTQIAAALDAVHAKGIVHRDVKPANVLVGYSDGERRYYLGDFGISKRMDTESGLTGTGQLIGTAHYIAPEQVEGHPVTPRTDVYSLAAMAYLLLTGRHVFSRPTDLAVVWAHARDEPGPPTQIRPDLPPGVDRVLLRGLAKSPDGRHPSCGTFALELARALAPLAHRDQTTVAGAGTAPAVAARAGATSTNTTMPGLLTTVVAVLASFTLAEAAAEWLNRWAAFALVTLLALAVLAGVRVVRHGRRDTG